MRRLSPLVLVLLAALAAAQDPGAPGAQAGLPQLKKDAAAAFAKGAYDKAAPAYRTLVEADPRDGDSWFHLGYALHAMGQLDPALAAHLKAAEFDTFRALALYNAGCAYALKGEQEKALSMLEKSVDSGFRDVAQLAKDDDLKGLREAVRFVALKGRIKEIRERGVHKVAVVLGSGFDLREVADALEVFGFAAAREGRFQAFTVAASAKPVKSAAGLDVEPQSTFADCPKPKVLVLPGGISEELLEDPELVAALGKLAAEAEIVLTIRDGAFVAHRLSLLDGIEVTTRDASIEALRAVAPKAKVVRRRLVVDAGKVVSTSGPHAGLDGALDVAARLVSLDAARRAAVAIDHDWRPAKEREAAEVESGG